METGPTQLTDTDCNELKSIWKFFTHPGLLCLLLLPPAGSCWNTKWQVWSCGVTKGCLMVLLSKNQTASCLLLFCFVCAFGRGGKKAGHVGYINDVSPRVRKTEHQCCLVFKKREASSPSAVRYVCSSPLSLSVWESVQSCSAGSSVGLAVRMTLIKDSFVFSVLQRISC